MPRDSREHRKTEDRGLDAYRPLFARTGIGYDSHRFVPGTSLVLGGVKIPSSVSLIGHSDADAVAHALIDAVLGGAGAGDTIEMLRGAVERVREHGFIVHQADLTVIAETPAIAPHREAMRARLAGAMGISPDSVSVKGKTNEGMGWIGRGEGLACIAVASLVPAP